MLSKFSIRIMLGIALLGNAVNLLLFTAGRLTREVPPIIPAGLRYAAGRRRQPAAAGADPDGDRHLVFVPRLPAGADLSRLSGYWHRQHRRDARRRTASIHRCRRWGIEMAGSDRHDPPIFRAAMVTAPVPLGELAGHRTCRALHHPRRGAADDARLDCGCRRWLPFRGLAVLVLLGCRACLAKVVAHGPLTMVMGRWLPPFGIAFTVDLFGALMALTAAIAALAGGLYALTRRRPKAAAATASSPS